jgi:hypothetical protein
VSSILRTLERPRGVPEQLSDYSFDQYRRRVAAIARDTLGLAARSQ